MCPARLSREKRAGNGVRATPNSSSADKGVTEHFRPFPGASVSSPAKGGIRLLWPPRPQPTVLRHELAASLLLPLPTSFGADKIVFPVKADKLANNWKDKNRN